MSPFLEVTDLAVRYGSVQALHGVSLHVERGETVALVGRNGAGKTTLLRTVFGYNRPSAGTVAFDGRSLAGTPPYRMARLGIAYVPEGRQVFNSITVLENLRLGALRARQGEDERLEQVFDLFPVLREQAHRATGSLSGGQQQMLAVGRALMCGPNLLLLDEPSLGLAPKVIGALFETLAELASAGLTTLLVEQNARRAFSLASRGYVLNLGRVMMEASAAQVLADERLHAAYLGRRTEATRRLPDPPEK